jgi:sarcosine oxidase subunit alpha
MTQPFRIAAGRIDRTRQVNFTFDGKAYTGYGGDTLASALLANGVHLTGRSFKYHRPRGILTAGAAEPNALCGVGRDDAHYTPNLPATQVMLYDGLRAESQNRNPSLAFDTASITDRLWRFVPAGFYYKTFMWPAKAWTKFFEPRIRAAAGLGRSPTAPDAARYAQLYAHCDQLIIGAGPAGLAAALTHAATGARIILCDEQDELGGSLLAEYDAEIDGKPAQTWLGDAIATLAALPNVTLLPRTTAFGYFPHNMVGLAQSLTDHLGEPDDSKPRGRLWQVRAGNVIIATGAIERPLVFPDNDRPGIMLADSARTYVQRYGVLPGRRVVVFTAHDEAYRAALALHKAGAAIAAIADLRPNPQGGWVEQARAAGLLILPNTRITGTTGRLRITGATLSTGARIPCDLLLMSGGFTPCVHLFSQSRGKLAYDESRQIFVPGTPAEATAVIGAAAGAQSLAEATGLPVSNAPLSTGGFLGLAQDGPGRAFVDFQNDVTAKDLKLALREGFTSIEHLKRYTTTGMATDQGKTSNMNALGIVSALSGVAIPAIGTTTFRMPYTPIPFGYFAGYARGELFEPARHTPIHPWAAAQGAVFEDVGQWRRARYFAHAGETMHQATARECLAVRQGAGIFDASTLGKIEIIGPGAAEFLNRFYINAWTLLKPGKLRYGVLLREDGFVLDDGVIGRLAEQKFHVTTTTGGAARVLAMMEDYLQTEWQDLDVWLTSTTEQWAVIALQGPKAREILAPFTDIDISAAAFPHMSVAEGHVAGVPARLFRVSFTGEIGYEINVPSDQALKLWEALYATGQVTPYGTETMHILRAEKGYIIAGQETDGTATPDDAGLAWAIGTKKPDFVGKRALARASMVAQTGRKQLVGILTDDPAFILEEGSHLVADPVTKIPATMLGHITSAYWSATLGRSIALAMVKDGRALHGKTLYVALPDRMVPVTLTDPVFYDTKGERINA